MKKAIQIGAGNIGRGLNGYILNKNNCEITFLDVSQEMIDQINETNQYKIIQEGESATTDLINNYKGYNILSQVKEVEEAISEAEVIFISIGISNLFRLKSILTKGLELRAKNKILKPLNIVAIENGINATDVLKENIFNDLNQEIKKYIDENVAFVNCAVDRIVPNQKNKNLDVKVEVFFELVLDETTWKGEKLNYVKYSSSLDKYIQRKLFMLNATHATIAWYGIKNSLKYIYEFPKDKILLEIVNNLLHNFVEILSRKFDFTKEELEEYSKKIISRLTNTAIKDEVERVGRGVKRKVSFNDRFMLPIRYASELNINYSSIIKALSYAFMNLNFEDPEVKEINSFIKSNSVFEAIKKYTGATDEITKKIAQMVEQSQI